MTKFWGFLTPFRWQVYYISLCRAHFTVGTFCIIWKDTIFTLISILNIFKKYYKDKKQQYILSLYSFCLCKCLVSRALKRFNMEIKVKMASFHIIQNILTVKSTLVSLTFVKPSLPLALHVNVVYGSPLSLPRLL